MMEEESYSKSIKFPVGTVVKSCRGHDRKRLYLVCGGDRDRLLLTDGRLRPFERPKRKHPGHVREVAPLEPALWSNIERCSEAGRRGHLIRAALKKYTGQTADREGV